MSVACLSLVVFLVRHVAHDLCSKPFSIPRWRGVGIFVIRATIRINPQNDIGFHGCTVILGGIGSSVRPHTVIQYRKSARNERILYSLRDLPQAVHGVTEVTFEAGLRDAVRHGLKGIPKEVG